MNDIPKILNTPGINCKIHFKQT